MKKLTKLAKWQALKARSKDIVSKSLNEHFAQDDTRFSRFSLRVNGLLLDYSKNLIDAEALNLLVQFASELKLEQKISELFSSNRVNSTEKRPVLHTALREQRKQSILVDGQDILPLIKNTLGQMSSFVQQVRDQVWLGATQKPITDIVNVGIGGSYLGPRMVTHALADFAHPKLNCHFVSNVDAAYLNDVLQQLSPETTLFIISSKSFTTLETLTNAKTIYRWMEKKLGTNNLENHFVAVTADKQKALQFGIAEKNIFPLWDWVGGRFSVWSAIGLPIALMLGMDGFMEFLQGAHEMDEHFRNAPFLQNMPVLMALLGIWYINFFDTRSQAVIPYSHRLHHIRAYLQQLDMESNGKQITHQNQITDYSTGPVIWGEQGCNGQHAFHQLLHQGQHVVPVDFILVGEGHSEFQEHHDILVASGLSQAQALMQGKTLEQAFQELLAAGLNEEDAAQLAPHKVIPGNRPSNILFLDKLTPRNVGALLALYEHKIFVQGTIWNINSFDQWGVELGKQLLPDILSNLLDDKKISRQDSSTRALIRHYRNLRISS